MDLDHDLDDEPVPMSDPNRCPVCNAALVYTYVDTTANDDRTLRRPRIGMARCAANRTHR